MWKVLSYLKSLTEESFKIIEACSIKDLNKNDLKYQYYSRVAAGSAAICCYQAALAFASNQKQNHIFISKYSINLARILIYCLELLFKRIRKKFKKVDINFSAIETRYGSGYRWNVS